MPWTSPDVVRPAMAPELPSRRSQGHRSISLTSHVCSDHPAGPNIHVREVVVRELPLTLTEYTEAIRSSLEDGDGGPIVDARGLKAMVAYLTDLPASHPIGAVHAKRLDTVVRRRSERGADPRELGFRFDRVRSGQFHHS